MEPEAAVASGAETPKITSPHITCQNSDEIALPWRPHQSTPTPHQPPVMLSADSRIGKAHTHQGKGAPKGKWANPGGEDRELREQL